jgi:hypothetical protein
MNYFKPYSYLYKNINDPEELKSCFVVWLPAGKNISGPLISTVADTTTITYSIVNDSNMGRDWRAEGENTISWDGLAHRVEVTIGSGSGANGGSCTLSSADAEPE